MLFYLLPWPTKLRNLFFRNKIIAKFARIKPHEEAALNTANKVFNCKHQLQ